MTEPAILLERDNGVALVTLNQPAQRNAIGEQMINELHAALDELVSDRELDAVVLWGAGGKAFAAGADIKLLLERRAHHGFMAINQSLFRRIEELPCPTIAAIRGYALGGGCELALACDMRVAGEGAKLGQPEVGLGIIPGAGGTQRLARLVGIARAKQLIFSGEIIDAARAEAIGLVNEVVPDDEVLDRAKALAGKIAEQSRFAVRMAKTAINAQFQIGPAPGFMLESVSQALCFEHEEKTRRMTEFVEERARRRAAREAQAKEGQV